MAHMSSKEARRRGSLPQTPSYGRGNNVFDTDIRLPENYAANVIREPIMFGGLGNVNWFGNEPESAMTGGKNLTTRGLYGAPSTDDHLEYLGNVRGLGNPVTDFLNKGVLFGFDIGHVALASVIGYCCYKGMRK